VCGRCRIDVSTREERIWPPERIRSLPEFHALVFRSGEARPQPVFCAPYWARPELRGRYGSDPYHSPDVASRKTAGTVTAAIAAAAVAAGAWTFTPSHVWRDTIAVETAVATARALGVDDTLNKSPAGGLTQDRKPPRHRGAR
jgi:hypothetical protein